jgi:hypothetical protein
MAMHGVESSPRIKAKIAGVFYLLTIVAGALAAVFMGHWPARYGDTANFVATVCYIVVTFLFYELFKPVNRNLSLFAAIFSLVGCAMGLSALCTLRPLISTTWSSSDSIAF